MDFLIQKQDPRYRFRLVKLKFEEKCLEGSDSEALGRLLYTLGGIGVGGSVEWLSPYAPNPNECRRDRAS